MMTENVILVDEQDRETGLMEKLAAHEQGLLHRAFSVFVFNTAGELLLQKRAAGKYHSPGLWTNTCCSHPRAGESTERAAHRRLMEEMGFDCPVHFSFAFRYRAELGDLVEHEYDHVFVGLTEEKGNPDPEEVAESRFWNLDEIEKQIRQNPEVFTAWFLLIWPRIAELKDLALEKASA